MHLFDVVLHLDSNLTIFVAAYGTWVYAILFSVIFVETGVVVMPFLPGDSLLFIVGALSASQVLDIQVAIAVMLGAAILGNQSNYTIGRWFGPRVFHWEHSRWFNKRGFDKAHAFYERWGGATLVIGRFLPLVRTFAPFVAGVAAMTRRRFTFFDVTGGTLWIFSVTLMGYYFGNVPWVKTNLNLIVLAMIVIPGVVGLIGALRSRAGRDPRR